MKKAILLIPAILAAMCVKINAQTNQAPILTNPTNWEYQMEHLDGNFYDIIDAAHQNLIMPQIEIEESETESEEQEKIMELSRFYNFWKSRVDGVNGTSGSFNFVQESYTNYIANPICGNENSLANWQYVGSNGDARVPSNPNRKYQKMGYVSQVVRDPNNSNVVYAGSNTGGLFKTTNFNDTDPDWVCVTENSQHLPGMGISNVLLNTTNGNNIIYITTALTINSNYNSTIELFKSIDGGTTWATTAFSGIISQIHEPIRGLVKDKFNPNVIYVMTNNKIYKTTDGFATVANTPSQPIYSDASEDFHTIEIDPNTAGAFYVGGKKLLKFTNYGSNNNNLTSNLPTTNSTGTFTYDIYNISPITTELWVRYKTTSNTGVENGYMSKASYVNLVAWSNISTFSGISTAQYGGVFRKSNSHNVNTNNGINDNGVFVGSYAFFGEGQGQFYKSAFGGQFVYKTLYSGFQTNNTFTHADIRAIDYFDTSGEIILGTDGGILYSNDYGETWQNKNGKGFHAQQFQGIGLSESNESVIVGGLQDSDHMSKGGNEWYISAAVCCDGYDAVVDPNNPNKGYTLGNASIKRLNNIGTSTFSYGGNLTLCPGYVNDWQMYKKPIAIDNQSFFYTAYNDIYKYNPITSAWTAVSALTTTNSKPSSKCQSFDLNPVDNNVIHAQFGGPTWGGALTNLLFRTTNGGTTWTDITAGLTHALWMPITDVVCDPNNSNHIFVCFGGYDVTRRMMFSDNGGATWYDISNGLPPFPINTLQFQKGTYCTLYAGTDVGTFVFRANQNHPIQNFGWQCFNKNAPTGIVVDLEINYCSGKLVASHYGRGVWATDIIPFGDVVINTNTVYNSPQKSTSNIIIESGYTLTINSRLDMSSNTSITVKRGASLIVDGANAIISNGCGARWQGIQVWGNTNLSQTAANAAEFGKVIVKNGGTIENAVTGVTTMKIDAQGNWDWNYTGGIIQCHNATFKNCGRAAQFLGYTNRNYLNQEIATTSYFRATHFILDNSYKSLDWGNPSYQVTIDNSSGINFKKCEFSNLNTNITDQNALGSGIYAINSRVNIGAEYYSIGAGGVITPIGRSTFSNMQFGVWTQYSSGSLRNMNVNATDFNNVLGSVTCFTGNKPTVNRCTFTTSSTFFPSSSNAIKWGVGLVGAPTFQVEENILTGSFPSTDNEVGIAVLGSGAATNTIYKNKFKNLTVGFETFGHNRGPLAPSGLQFICNEFNNNKQDNFVGDCFITGLGACNAYGIAYFQGTPAIGTTPAISPRNKFISSSPTAEMNLKNVTLSPIVYINSTTPNPLYDLTYYTPSDVTTSAVATSITGCPSNLNLYKKVLDGKVVVKVESVKIGIDDNHNDITNIKNLLNATVDGGNTQAVINEIVSAQPQEIQQTVQELLQKSPNLSDDVIYEVAFADDKFTQITQMLILAANPQAGRNLDLMNRLTEKANPMPSIMIEYIVNATTFHSNKEKIESLLADLYHQNSDLNKLQYEYFENDSIGIDPDSLYFYAKNADSPQAIYGVVSALINDGLTTEAQTIYTAIPSQFRFTTNEEQEYSNYGTLMNHLITIKQNNWELKQIDAATIQELKSLVETSNLNYATLAAKSMITYFEDKYNETYIHLPYEESNARKAKTIKHKPTLEEIIGLYGKPQNGLSIVPFAAYPNPANESITFTYDFSANITDGKIIISTEAGKVLTTLTMPKNKNKIDVPLTNYSSGIYLYQVICDDKTFKSDKFTVVK